MKLTRNSWFLKSYLQYNEWERPYTVCQLGRRIVGMTVVWIVAALFVLAATVPLLAVIGGAAVVLFTDKVFGDVFNASNPLALFAAMYLLVGVIVGIYAGVNKIGSAVNSRRYRSYKAGPVRQFTRGIWSRIKDKTCVMIEYDNGVEERVRKREWYSSEEKQ